MRGSGLHAGARSEKFHKNIGKGKPVVEKKPGLPVGKLALAFLVFVLVGSSIFSFVQGLVKPPKRQEPMQM